MSMSDEEFAAECGLTRDKMQRVHPTVITEFEQATEVGEKEFKAYESAKRSGKWNMILDSSKVMKSTGLTSDQYAYIIEHYNELNLKYGD